MRTESERLHVVLITRYVLLWISRVLQSTAHLILALTNGGSPVSQPQAIPEEVGEGRETSRTGEKITPGWAM